MSIHQSQSVGGWGGGAVRFGSVESDTPLLDNVSDFTCQTVYVVVRDRCSRTRLLSEGDDRFHEEEGGVSSESNNLVTFINPECNCSPLKSKKSYFWMHPSSTSCTGEFLEQRLNSYARTPAPARVFTHVLTPTCGARATLHDKLFCFSWAPTPVRHTLESGERSDAVVIRGSGTLQNPLNQFRQSF